MFSTNSPSEATGVSETSRLTGEEDLIQDFRQTSSQQLILKHTVRTLTHDVHDVLTYDIITVVNVSADK